MHFLCQGPSYQPPRYPRSDTEPRLMGMVCGFYSGVHTVPPKEAKYPKEESGSIEDKEEAEMLRLNYRKVGNY